MDEEGQRDRGTEGHKGTCSRVAQNFPEISRSNKTQRVAHARSERIRCGRHVAGAATQQRHECRQEEEGREWQREGRGKNECPLPLTQTETKREGRARQREREKDTEKRVEVVGDAV